MFINVYWLFWLKGGWCPAKLLMYQICHVASPAADAGCLNMIICAETSPGKFLDWRLAVEGETYDLFIFGSVGATDL
jgi:hypothetical protein